MLASIDFQEFHVLQLVQTMQTLILVLQVGLLQYFQFYLWFSFNWFCTQTVFGIVFGIENEVNIFYYYNLKIEEKIVQLKNSCLVICSTGQQISIAPNEQFTLLNRASSKTTSRETEQGAT